MKGNDAKLTSHENLYLNINFEYVINNITLFSKIYKIKKILYGM